MCLSDLSVFELGDGVAGSAAAATIDTPGAKVQPIRATELTIGKDEPEIAFTR
jgi:hypothetical protein